MPGDVRFCVERREAGQPSVVSQIILTVTAHLANDLNPRSPS